MKWKIENLQSEKSEKQNYYKILTIFSEEKEII
jgi:hypothetical protein